MNKQSDEKKTANLQTIDELGSTEEGTNNKADHRHLVTIHYHEPTYGQYTGHSPRSYNATYEVIAPNQETAVELALKEFHDIKMQSMVGWVRMVDKVDCQILTDDIACNISGTKL